MLEKIDKYNENFQFCECRHSTSFDGNNLPDGSVVTVTGMLYGPIPIEVLAAILHTYIVYGCNESRIR